LLSCGKDNRTICWNPRTGQPYGEFPVVTNWTFQTRWNPHNPSLLATASFDGKIAVQTIQNTNGTDSTAGAQRPKLDGEAFFDNAQTQPQEATFSLPTPPKWLECPVGVSFGFGGKVVSFGPEDTTGDSASRKSKIRISQFEVDSSVGNATETFEKAIQQGDLASICQSKISTAKSEEEKADWSVIETLIAADPRSKLVSHLGFSQAVDEATGSMDKLGVPEEDQKFDGSPDADKHVNGAAKSNRLSSFFDKKDDGDNFLSDLAATKGAKTNNPFEIYTGSETAPDKQITKALLVGRFEEALDICLKEQRMSDAFMIAICGGQTCIEKAKAAYFTKKAHGPNYLRLLASVAGKNLWDVVHNANLKDWKETMAMLCTFAEPKEFPDLCEALGDRLEEELKGKTADGNLRKDASLCYMAGSKLESVVKIWVEELKRSEGTLEDTTGDSAFSIHARSLQNLIEKVTVFRAVTKFQDTERTQSSDWKLAPLYDKYAEYADVVAAHGQLEVAEKYLDLLPPNYPAAEVARNRVKQASRKAAPTPAARQPTNATRTASRAQSAIPGYQAMQAPQTTIPANPYAMGGGAAQPQNPYAPGSNAYAPSGYQAQQAQGYSQNQAPQMYGGYQQQQQPPQKVGIPPPPRNTTASPAMPPASKRTDIPNWNDTPLVAKPPTSRRGTPGVGPAPITSPFPNQPSQPLASPPPTGAPFSMQQRATPPVAPPPKGSAPARVSSPLVSSFQQNSFQQPERPSSALNAYAPAPSTSQLSNPAPSIPRGASPYNAPPSAPPPSNRYAPSVAPQLSASSMQQPGSIAPPPQGGARPGPPQNPYAPQQQNQFASHTAQSPYPGSAPTPNFSQSSSSGPPQRGPPSQAQISRPGTAQSGSTPIPAPIAAPKYRKLATNYPRNNY
jgi:protein transport protein SEC31